MPPQSSRESFREADRLNHEASRSFVHADFGSAIADTWGAGMNRIRATGQLINEATAPAINSVTSATHETLEAADPRVASALRLATDGRPGRQFARQVFDEGNRRVTEHYRDNPLTALIEGPAIASADALIRGGISPTSRTSNSGADNRNWLPNLEIFTR